MKRHSMPSPGPLSPASLSRPASVTSVSRPRLSSEAPLHSGDGSESRNVRVVLRIKPSEPSDPSVPPRFRSVLVHPISPADVRLDIDPAALAGAAPSATTGSKRHPTFSFEHVLGEQASQEELYDVTAGQTVDEFIKGHNVTFLAYGQTSSGKSYSMGTTGDDIDYSGTRFTPRTGLIPRTVQTIFERAEAVRLQSGPGASWECRLSFLELYNEEIIDLLSGTGVAITIREERDGRIVWAGVREVKVKSLAEVMQLLQDGSARRKTGETTMNASSSRSHAIFSLTLVQKKRAIPIATGMVSPSTPTGRETPTRLRRPASVIGLPSPRSPTPTTTRGGPPSSYGRATPSRPTSMQSTPSASSEFVILTSKFNMVDLAGSERLKRTAAQGERMKEGISINSGLLALGNVISTLCDPVKARGHIPYRDSKLTRMLQDSIGGNSLTTMIACVSAIEANIGETINTIKYASRARNIKNVARLNQVEAGWDDVEHLQNTVLKLRKQLVALEVDGKNAQPAQQASEDSIRQSEKLIQRLTELQKEHTELYDQYLYKCSENMRLSGELKSRTAENGETADKFNEIVEPVILEYEKVVSALNIQLDDLRGELSSMDEIYVEQTRQLQEVRDHQNQSETYVNELRARLAKVTERNTASELYVQDLEAKLKAHSDTDDSRSDIVAMLKQDITNLKEENAQLAQHAAQIEARLSKSETQAESLSAQVEKQEKDAERREAAYRDLKSQITLLDSSQDNKLLLRELEQRDLKLAELERRLEERSEFEEKERARLLATIDEEKALRSDLSARLADLTSPMAAGRRKSSTTVSPGESASKILKSRVAHPAETEMTPPESPQSRAGESVNGLTEDVDSLKAALKQLSAKYNEAELKVSELASQLSEAKLVHAELDDVVDSPGTPPPPSLQVGQDEGDDASSDVETTVQTPGDDAVDTSPTPSSRRGSMPIITMGVKGQDFRRGRGYGESRRARPQSLSQELSFARSLGSSQRASWTHSNSSTFSNNGLLLSPISGGTSPQRGPIKSVRSSQSLEAELKFVHRIVEERDEELKIREAHIRQLEEILQKTQKHVIPSRTSATQFNQRHSDISSIRSVDTNASPSDIPLPESPVTPRTPSGQSQAASEPQCGDCETVETDDGCDGLRPPDYSTAQIGHLSPRSVRRHDLLQDSLHRLESGVSDTGGSHIAVTELMRQMIDKEQSQKKIIEQQFVQIADLQKANNRLKDEIDEESQVRRFTISRPERNPESRNGYDLLEDSPAEHARAIAALQAEHIIAIHQIQATLEKSEAAHRIGVENVMTQHNQAIADLQQSHASGLSALQAENDLVTEEMEKSLAASEEQRRQLKMKADQALFELSRIRDVHALQRNADEKEVAHLNEAVIQLQDVKAQLEGTISELQAANAELNKRVIELEHRSSRRTPNPPPPQGPPPSTPLPPIPHPLPGRSNSLGRSSLSSMGHGLESQENDSGQKGSERESARELSLVKRVQDMENQLNEESVKVNNLTIDLRDTQKTNTKLRAHLEEARNENKRRVEACTAHMSELETHRAQLEKLDEDKRSHRESLLAAQAQVASLRTQLERVVDRKVDKRLLKCF
ncbi:hypothetical protein IAU60_004165 [Kwoniella sp. DSM 27419]